MRNPQPICSCPRSGRIHGSRRKRKHEQLDDATTIISEANSSERKNSHREKKNSAASESLSSDDNVALRRADSCVPIGPLPLKKTKRDTQKALDTPQRFHTSRVTPPPGVEDAAFPRPFPALPTLTVF